MQIFVRKCPTCVLMLTLLVACESTREGDGDPPMADAVPLDGAIADGLVADPDAAPPDAAPPDAALPPIGGDRPALVYAPTGAPPPDGWPILLLLHGFGAAPPTVDRNFPFAARVDQDGWIVVLPEGRRDADGKRYWAADFHVEPDGRGADVDYLLGVIDEVAARHHGDPARVVVMGHSNGGAMAQHLACYAADRLVAYVDVSGFNLPVGACAPARPIAALHVHGLADMDVPYDGRDDRPGSLAAAADWADRVLGCADPEAPEGPFDYDLRAGAETTVTRWAGCREARVEHWAMADVGHLIIPTPAFLDAVRAFVLTD